MISVGSRDGRKGLSLGYGVEGGEMDLETELEEGEACFQNNNDDESKIDPDVALSYIDEKLQDVLGHFQKDFEGGVSAENLGAKFGGYGSFLPTYQRSPACPHPKTPPKVLTYNASVSPNNLHIEGGPQNPSGAPQPARHGPASASGAAAPAPRGPPVKQEVHTSSARPGDKFTSNGQQHINASDQKTLKVRIKVGSDNLSTRKNAEIYSGLGLDDSPSSSLEASPVDNDDFCHVHCYSLPYESPTSILEMMTSFPVLGGLLLSPLPHDLLYLTENKKWEDGSCGPVHKGSQESPVTVNRFDSSKTDRTKPKSSEDNIVLVEPTNANNVRNGISGLTKKDAHMDNVSCEELVSNALKLPLLSNNNVTDFKKGVAFTTGSSAKEESVDPVSNRDDIRVEKPYRKEGISGNANSDEKYPVLPSDSDVSKSSKGLDKARKQKATSREKDGTKSASKKKSKGNPGLENGFHSVEASKVGLKNDSSSTSKSKNNNGKVRETYKDFFGELDPELEDGDDVALDEKPFGDKLKDNRGMEKGTLESNILSKERLNGKKAQNQKPSSSVYPRVGPLIAPIMGTGPLPDAGLASVAAAVVNEDWVGCDKCEKWRLLPPGVNPGSLPEKWLCSMLDWLPGMNRCSISQEETTKAIASHFYAPVPTVHPGGPISVDPDQRHQPFGPQIGLKRKPGSKDPPNEPKPDRPSLSSNSTKKNLQSSNKSRSLNGTNHNEVEFQDSGQSSSLIAEKHRLKQKDKKKPRENFVDEGNNDNQMKIRNKREMSQDYSRDSKKVKIDGNHGTDEDRAINSSASDLAAGISRKDRRKHNDHPEDSKSGPKNKNGTLQTAKFEDGDIAKKRKSNEFEDHETYVEETSETGHRKGKKPRVPESREEDTFSGKGVKNTTDLSKRDTVLAATSSSSKVSGSHKTKPNNPETKGSPVESVSSSPLRVSNLDKFTSSRRNIDRVDNINDLASPKKDWEDDRVGLAHLSGNNIQTDIIGHNEDRKHENQSHTNGSRGRKNGKGSSSRSKDKFRNSNENKSQEKPSVNAEKGSVSKIESVRKPSSENAKRDSRSNHGHHDDAVSIQDVKPNVPVERDGERSSKKELSGRGKSHSLPPSGRGQNEMTRKEIPGNSLTTEATGGVDASKAPKPKKKTENLNGNQPMNVKHPTPNRHKGRDHDTPSRELSSQAASSAIKEAKAVKHMADRLKNLGSNHESKTLYFQAALKFLYGASLLESCSSESGKHGDMIQSTGMYSSTAKLCEYVAHEYEKSKEMAAAALAHKLAEVAYLKVIYSSHSSASKDRQELQTSLHIGATGESPSSSASDIDNLNNPAAIDKTALAKSINSPQIGGNHIIAARNKPNFMRILNFAQDVSLAMEASRRSQMAFAASGSKPEEAQHKEVIKPALDFNFQDVEGLLQLVRVAMEVISK